MSILALGFLIGLKHALEADHVAAVATLVSSGSSIPEAARIGAIWGIGHSFALLVTGFVVVTLDTVVPDQFVRYLELAVGIMLVGLGMDVVRRVVVDRIHFHVHRHNDGTVHFHAHSHRSERGHAKHSHQHSTGLGARALAVGLLHGLAGSAVLILMALAKVESLLDAAVYLCLFGIGSIAGMAVLSLVIAIPFRVTSQRLRWAGNLLQCGLGLATITIGVVLLGSVWPLA